jgi:hypothetical protein
MTITITTEKFLAACRHVLGDDKPATVLDAIRDDDPRMRVVSALAARGPDKWFCAAIDENGIVRLGRKGATEEEARKRAELAVTKRRKSKQSWTFDIYPPGALK